MIAMISSAAATDDNACAMAPGPLKNPSEIEAIKVGAMAVPTMPIQAKWIAVTLPTIVAGASCVTAAVPMVKRLVATSANTASRPRPSRRWAPAAL